MLGESPLVQLPYLDALATKFSLVIFAGNIILVNILGVFMLVNTVAFVDIPVLSAADDFGDSVGRQLRSHWFAVISYDVFVATSSGSIQVERFWSSAAGL